LITACTPSGQNTYSPDTTTRNHDKVHITLRKDDTKKELVSIEGFEHIEEDKDFTKIPQYN